MKNHEKKPLWLKSEPGTCQTFCRYFSRETGADFDKNSQEILGSKSLVFKPTNHDVPLNIITVAAVQEAYCPQL